MKRSFVRSIVRLIGWSVAPSCVRSVLLILCPFVWSLVWSTVDRSFGSSVPRLIGWLFVRHLCLYCKSKGAAFEIILEFKRNVKFKAKCLFLGIFQPHESWGYRGRGWNWRIREWRRNRQGKTGKNNDNTSETNSHLTKRERQFDDYFGGCVL